MVCFAASQKQSSGSNKLAKATAKGKLGALVRTMSNKKAEPRVEQAAQVRKVMRAYKL